MSNEYNKYSVTIAEGCVDAIHLIEQKKLSEFTDVITNIIDAKLDQMAEEYDLTEEEMLDEQKSRGEIIRKVGPGGKVSKHKFCGPGFKLDPVTKTCKPQSSGDKRNIAAGQRSRKKKLAGKRKVISRKQVRTTHRRKQMGI